MLFGILGGLFTYAAFQSHVQPFAFIAGFVSVLSFFYLTYTVGGFNQAIKNVVIADIVALGALIVGATLYIYQQSL